MSLAEQHRADVEVLPAERGGYRLRIEGEIGKTVYATAVEAKCASLNSPRPEICGVCWRSASADGAQLQLRGCCSHRCSSNAVSGDLYDRELAQTGRSLFSGHWPQPLHWSRSGSRDRWLAYGLQVQQAWREQLMPGTPPEFDPDEPF